MRNRVIVLGLLIVLLAAFPLAVYAQTGHGTAYLRGEGWVRIAGQGTLAIRDRAGDAVIEITSGEDAQADTVPTERRGALIFRGFNGEAYVEGSAITVAMRGTDITLEAEGTGLVILHGTGTYEFNGAQGEWTADGVRLSVTGTGASGGG